MNEDQARRLFERAALPYGAQSRLAREVGVSRSHISHMLARRKPMSDDLLAALGLRRVVSYEKVRG